MTTANVVPTSPFYSQLLGRVDNQILHLQDKRNTFLLDKVEEQNIKYFLKNVLDQPWNNHLLLSIFIQTDNQLETISILTTCGKINSRLKDIFHSFSLKNMNEFRVDVHFYQYLKGIIHPEHSAYSRKEALLRYKVMDYATRKWISSKIPIEQQAYFKRFLFDTPSFNHKDFSFGKLARELSHHTRKSETDAIVGSLPQIRAEGHFRWNQLQRLRTSFLKACEESQRTEAELPLEFDYPEPERIGEQFYFRLWDKPSFVLHHHEKFAPSSIKAAQHRSGAYSPDNNHYFVEFIRAESTNSEDDAEGLWFTELFSEGVIGNWFSNGTENEIKKKRELLLSWGYGAEDGTSSPVPFNSMHKGILTPSTFISRNKEKAQGVLLDVEPLYVSATFGLLALDIFTTTGARLNELLQLNHTPECIKAVEEGSKLHYSFYAVPKGRDEVEAFYVTEQTMKLISKLLKMLKEHYKSKKIPKVKYRYYQRKHIFKEPKPYFFQYHGKAMTLDSLASSFRFLLHGLRMETQEGKPVVIKTHLLRHAFATEAVQRGNMSLDIVAKVLHHRNLTTTAYYSEPTASIVGEKVGELHDIILDYIDIDEAVLRHPEELESVLKEHKEKVGVFNNVLGGTCVTDHVCPIKMACLGCQAKIPQPEKKHELEEVIELSKDMEKRYKALGLPVEVKKARKMRKDARIELKEIEQIEIYREEQGYEPQIRFDK
ncbi:site-specific integrase [Priestia megaterium]|uniref:site-specific integrase n=1 Tax=Priestia megaterium TaxID=1404 RepID=UPI00398CCE55